MSTFTHMMDLAVVNLYVMFKYITKSSTLSKIAFNEFKGIVCKEFITQHRHDKDDMESFYNEDHSKHYDSLEFKDIATKSTKSIWIIHLQRMTCLVIQIVT